MFLGRRSTSTYSGATTMRWIAGDGGGLEDASAPVGVADLMKSACDGHETVCVSSNRLTVSSR